VIAASTTPMGASNGRASSPNEIAKSITGRDYLSYSQVTTYQNCKLKWFFTYVESAEPESIAAPLLLGSSVHAALQHHLEGQLAAERPATIDELMNVFREKWKAEARDTAIEYSWGENTDSQADVAKRMLVEFLASPYSRPEGQTLGIEETLRVPLHPEIPDLVAKVDLIAAVDHELVITDFKTTRSMWGPDTAAEHAVQLHMYAEAAKCIAEDLGLRLRLRFIVLTKAKSPKVQAIEIATDPRIVMGASKIIRNVFKSMQSGVVYPSPSAMNCSGCPFKQRCANWRS
jgi:CRISPR/Cas system-associated exonuclease Cas4 (RecB family)